jgi:heme/copper-type cytochrome/quinol oxidase subunit 2
MELVIVVVIAGVAFFVLQGFRAKNKKRNDIPGGGKVSKGAQKK